MSNKITQSELADIKQHKQISRSYTNGEVTVYWKPELCIHSANCLIGLPKVFNSSVKPWINPGAASTDEIIKVVNTCPSRALTYLKNSHQAACDEEKPASKEVPAARIQILKNGPALIHGNYIIIDAQGQPIESANEVAAICRCGATKKKPFCDGTHQKIGFTD